MIPGIVVLFKLKWKQRSFHIQKTYFFLYREWTRVSRKFSWRFLKRCFYHFRDGVLLISQILRNKLYLGRCKNRWFIKRQTSSTSSGNEWQRMTTSDNEWHRVVQRVTTSDNEWYKEWQWVTRNDKEWQRVTISANISFFQIREEATTKHPKENSLNIEEDLWRRPIELRAETSP